MQTCEHAHMPMCSMWIRIYANTNIYMNTQTRKGANMYADMQICESSRLPIIIHAPARLTNYVCPTITCISWSGPRVFVGRPPGHFWFNHFVLFVGVVFVFLRFVFFIWHLVFSLMPQTKPLNPKRRDRVLSRCLTGFWQGLKSCHKCFWKV